MSGMSWGALLTWISVAMAAPPVAVAEPVRLGVVGLTHTHVHWIFESAKRRDEFEIVGIVEPNRALAERYSAQHGFDLALVHDSLETMLAVVRPEGVTAFGTIREHLAIVEATAPLGIHVMVEKPLAINLDHARRMAALAKRHGTHLLTNYETSWYASHHEAKARVRAGEIGSLRKAVFRHGHAGPKAIGVNDEFLEWLIDPHWNGAGALTDFGCYGANLAVWLMDGARPSAVTAVTRQLQPAIYPLVDDEATIIVDWEGAQALIQASWNWPVSRKDMALYGTDGELLAPDGEQLTQRFEGDEAPSLIEVRPLAAPSDDPFAWFAAVIRGEVDVPPFSPGALDNNLLVMEILQAAMDSAAEGRTVRLAQ